MQTHKPTDNRIDWIRTTLESALQPTFLEVIDQGWQHAGHAEEGAGHFLIRIAAQQFKGIASPVEQHRLVYNALGEAVGKMIHALQIEILT